MYSAMLLLRSESLYLRLSGAASAGVIVLPVAAALVAYRLNRGFEPAEGLLNADEPKAADAPVEEPGAAAVEARAHTTLSRRARLAALAVLAAGLLSMAAPSPE